MALWKIIPRDPLIFRDGKPFTADAGARAKSLIFPFPSSIAGAVRTLAGTDLTTGEFDETMIEELLKKQIRGPLLAEEQNNGKLNWLMPAPADCLLLPTANEEKARRIWLRPISLPKGGETNLKENLFQIGPSEIIKDKPILKPPLYWNWDYFKKWLFTPEDDPVTISELGHAGPVTENRLHVSIDPETGTGKTGALFQTSGLEFVHLRTKKNELRLIGNSKKLCLMVDTNAELSAGIGFLGGERRVARWISSEHKLPPCSEEIKKHIRSSKACRLVLLTPAYFEDGFLPTWLIKEFAIEISGVVNHRYQAISGWNYEKREPKPTRRLAPAGSVYYIKLNQDKKPDDFIDAVWMKNISDDEQNRLDGFGLAALGTWDGIPKEIVMKVRS